MKSLRSKVYSFAIMLSVATVGVGCISLFSRVASHDNRLLTLQTVSLFSQREPSRLAKRHWKGDWIFRRSRLEYVDAELRNVKPDVLFVQEVMEKIGSRSDSDEKILMAGALAEYAWRQHTVANYEDTQEEQSMAIVANPALSFVDAKGSKEDREFWIMGHEGYLMAATVMHEGQPINFFNVQMAPRSDGQYRWYSFIQERVQERLKRYGHCSKRLAIAGLLPDDDDSRRFGEFMQALDLKDVSSGFCQIASRCYTATPTNDIFLATVGDETPSRIDKIFVHQSAYVYGSSRAYEVMSAQDGYVKEFGLNRLWPTQRFGWTTSVRFARCQGDQLEEPIK